MKEKLRTAEEYIRFFGKWTVMGLMLGIMGGFIGALFSHSVHLATDIRHANPWIVWLLPVAGLIIVFIYRLRGLHPTDTNGVLVAVREHNDIGFSTAPLIFIGTVLTHFFGGSAGREGAALQMGGSLGRDLAGLMHQDEKDSHIMVMTGMSAVFAALFGTPVTAAVFSMEVISVGIIHFSAFVPCLTAGLVASILSKNLGAPGEHFSLIVPDFTAAFAGSTALIAAVAAFVSIVFCLSLSQAHRIGDKKIPNPYLRIALAGLTVAVLTWIEGSGDYNGAGMHIIENALAGNAKPEAFLLKIVFTTLTMSFGYKGGEIVPSLFIGATLGCTLGSLLGMPAGFGAAIGMLSMFCGCLNCPISTILLGLEMFGGGNLRYFAIAAAVSYVLSGNFGLYHRQKLMYSKVRPEYINTYTH